ncbi:MAG: hypothetical protein Q7S21_05635 [archaeon]|nr:hypothetical protein [archaeon]
MPRKNRMPGHIGRVFEQSGRVEAVDRITNPLMKANEPDLMWYFELMKKARKEIEGLRKAKKSLPETSTGGVYTATKKSASRKKAKKIDITPELMYKLLLRARKEKLFYEDVLKAEIIRLKAAGFEEETISEAGLRKKAISNLANWGIKSKKKK